jgi:hypothetical protein
MSDNSDDPDEGYKWGNYQPEEYRKIAGPGTDWNAVRIQAAIANMAAQIGALYNNKNGEVWNEFDEAVKAASCADALVAELKKGDGK